MSTSRSTDTIFSCSLSSPCMSQLYIYSYFNELLLLSQTHTHRERERERDYLDNGDTHGLKILVQVHFGRICLWGYRTSINVCGIAQEDACLHHELSYVPSSPKYQDLALLSQCHYSPSLTSTYSYIILHDAIFIQFINKYFQAFINFFLDNFVTHISSTIWLCLKYVVKPTFCHIAFM